MECGMQKPQKYNYQPMYKMYIPLILPHSIEETSKEVECFVVRVVLLLEQKTLHHHITSDLSQGSTCTWIPIPPPLPVPPSHQRVALNSQ